MGLMDTLRKPAVGGPVAGLVLVIAIVLGVMNSGDDPMPTRAGDYYFDIETSKVFVADASQLPPIAAPSGAGNGMKAYVFSCSDCGDASSHFVAYIEKYSEEAKAVMGDREKLDIVDKGHQLRAGDGGEWVLASSEEGQKLISSPPATCKAKGGKTQICQPE